MTKPYLSVVIPAYNEEARIASTIRDLVGYLSGWPAEDKAWEILVVNDGSTDSTASIVAEIGETDVRVRLVDVAHAGKGAAVRRGMAEAAGEWRFLCDADLSMPAYNLGRFFNGPGGDVVSGPINEIGSPSYDVSIGSREAPGARRFNEPRSRHIKGRLFNYAVKVLALRGVEDTQCGFKLFSAEAAERLFPHQSLDGWAFDVELLVMANKAGFTVGEVPIDWYYGAGSKMTLTKGVIAVIDVARVGARNLLGKYRIVGRKSGL